MSQAYSAGSARAGLAPLLTLAMTACTAATGSTNQELDLDPATLDDAVETLSRIDAMLAADPLDEEALAALEVLEPRLDELNGLVARVEPRPGHVVSFYETLPGVIGISESAPIGEDGLLEGSDIRDNTATELFRMLSDGTEPPAALVEAEERARAAAAATGERAPVAGSSMDGSSAGLTSAPSTTIPSDVRAARETLTAAGGPYFRDTYCFNQQADARGCYPNWANGGWAAGHTKTSFLTVAPYYGSVFIRFQYEGATRLVTPAYAGEVRNYWWHSSSWSFLGGGSYDIRHHRWDILNASGDQFHWAYAFRWGCFFPGDCNVWPR